MINVYFNDKIYKIQPSLSLRAFLKQLNYTQQYFAVAINNHHVPHKAYEATILQANDRVDILFPMQGG
ncbi:TPA: sulfur carrier protein ThiS [Legionella pneumophila]|uniref:sulfur carrier protein ThiS n=1 Tax=Legionella pneumophila TaxID=446 RepID=UPI0004854181|nr:sulfur carrier protein ThiS [Legionella pneumophila]AMQ27856.1 thiamine biosynthesis protein ThiS [Legionella pneumophila subsp. pneumophila]MBN5929921.1 sulfur carrier protein ThiS [Legionella pneumophila]PQM72215.1 thiamine biosynthesis protein ThiS [Legionella pneumophila]TIG67549.1 thiamine biosynthesis protein ThiS [Legionella pneumophila]TIG74847.1 thiamine biosynthesis protein ThiS [Legionella pneumophila]